MPAISATVPRHSVRDRSDHPSPAESAPIIQVLPAAIGPEVRASTSTGGEWLARLRQRWWVVAGLGLVGAIVGAAVALSREPVFEHRVLFQIGQGADGSLLEAPGPVRTRLVHAYLPAVWTRLREREPDLGPLPEPEATLPPGAGLILLSMQAAASHTDTVVEAMNLALAEADASLAGRSATSRIRLRNELAAVTARLQTQQSQLATVPERRAILESGVGELAAQLADLEALVDERVARDPELAAWEGKEAALAMILDDRQADRSRHQTLRDQLVMQLPERSLALESERTRLETAITESQAEIARLQARIEALRPTRVLSEPARRSEPMGLAWPTASVLGALLAALMGAFALGVSRPHGMRQSRDSR